jgi:hypothetical protein
MIAIEPQAQYREALLVSDQTSDLVSIVGSGAVAEY